MGSLQRAAPLLGVSLAALLLSAAPASAADEVTIDHVESAGGLISMVVSVDAIPGTTVGGSDISVQIDGRAVDAKVEPVMAGDVERSTILVVDASNSMRGAKFSAASDAITAFLATAPPDVKVGMVAFAGTVGTTVAPTTDRTSLLEQFKSLELGAGTGVYDAVAEAVTLAGTEGSRSLLLLSDGADTGSSSTLDEVAQAAAAAEVVVDVVPIGSATKVDALATLAEQTTGQVIPADADALSQVFADQAEALAQQLLVSVDVPEGVDTEADISVSVLGVGTTYTDSAFVNVRESSAPVEVAAVSEVVGKPLVSTPFMLAGAAALFLGLMGLLWTMLAGGSGRQSSVDKRLNAYFTAADGHGDASATQGKGRGRRTSEATTLKESAVAMTGQLVNADLETRILQRLAGAGSALTAAEWVLLHTAIAFGVTTVFFFLFGGGMALLGLGLGAILPWVYLKRRHSRRLNDFNGQLAETLDLMAGGLQAGLSLPQAIDTVVRQGHDPMVGELRRALVEQRLGVDITDALQSLGERMESQDFAWVVMAIRIQRDVGGNLSEILRTVAETLREREYLRRQVKSLSAEGRISGYILTALPIIVFFYMMVANREYVAVLWTTALGWMMLAMALTLLTLGGWAMKKLATVEV